MKRFDIWLMNRLDGLYYSSRPGTWRAGFAAELCMWQLKRFERRYGEAPIVTNG